MRAGAAQAPARRTQKFGSHAVIGACDSKCCVELVATVGQTRGMDDVVVERVLRAVELVPRGRVVSYGDLAALVGIGPRQVGTIMATYGSNVTWWRVTNASGDLPVQLMDEVRERWAAEGILLKPNGRGCRIAGYRADLTVLAAGYQRAVADLA